MNFDRLPEVGFAMQHYSKEYSASYGNIDNKCVEIAYINSGAVKVNFNNSELIAEEGDILILFRHLPIFTETVGDKINSHYTVLAEFSECDIEISEAPQIGGLTLPFIIRKGDAAEEAGRRIRRIARDMAENGRQNALTASIEFLSALKLLSESAFSDEAGTAYRKIAAAATEYIEENQNKKISLSDIARHIGKSPNHVGKAFKAVYGTSIVTYMGKEKIKRVAMHMLTDSASFDEACRLANITDTVYGYKLFKKHMGITPKEYLTVKKLRKD